MSFGYAVGDVIAVLGLFERIAIELRNYKDAPSHFQQLSVEIDLLHKTLQHVLHLEPKNDAERQTIEQVRAIAMHCLQPLQALVDKLRSKETSLGHFRTTRSLSNVGTRLHWSMVAQKDVDEIRKTILSEMVAINMLLSVQQLCRINQISSQIMTTEKSQSALIKSHSDAMMKQTSHILSIVSATPRALAELQSNANAQAEQQSKRLDTLYQGLSIVTNCLDTLSLNVTSLSTHARKHAATLRIASNRLIVLTQNTKELLILLARCSKDMLDAIGRNTVELLNIASQLKRITRAIEAIPLHLTLDIVRLDDALGESWALPLQACRSWDSFCDLLTNVVYANNRPGFSRIASEQFVVSLAKTGQNLHPAEWATAIKAGIHIEQSMVTSGASLSNTGCPYLGCNGLVSAQTGNPAKACSSCGRWATVQKVTKPTVKLYGAQGDLGKRQTPFYRGAALGPQLPPMQNTADDFHHFRRVQIYEPSEPVRDLADAEARLNADDRDPAANLFVGLRLLQDAEDMKDGLWMYKKSRQYLEAAVKSGDRDGEAWYLLARACIGLGHEIRAYEALKQAAMRLPRSPSVWITIAQLYWRVGQDEDSLESLSRALRINPYLSEVWFNLGVLYTRSGQSNEALFSFERSLQLNPQSHVVQSRYEILLKQRRGEPWNDLPDAHEIHSMRDCKIRILDDEGGAEIVIEATTEAQRFDSKITNIERRDTVTCSLSEEEAEK